MHDIFCIKFSQEWVLKFSRNLCLKLCSKFNNEGGFLANFDLKNAKNSLCFKLQMLDQNQVINAKTPMLKIARFCHRTELQANTIKIWTKILQKLNQLLFFPIKRKMADHDEIPRNFFTQIQKLYEIICHSRPISHLQLKAFRNKSSLKMKGQNHKIQQNLPSHYDILHVKMGYLLN